MKKTLRIAVLSCILIVSLVAAFVLFGTNANEHSSRLLIKKVFNSNPGDVIPTQIAGDVDGNGAVNVRDAARLLQYLAGWEVECVNEALDANGDGSVDNNDVTAILRSIVGWSDNDLVYGNDPCEHQLTYVEAVAVSCTVNGNNEYWKCGNCGKLFKDESCAIAVTESYTVISASGHIEVIDAAAEPTCTAPGSTEGKHCSVCGEVFVAQTVIDALGHSGDIVRTVNATCAGNGYTERECFACGMLYLSEATWAAGHSFGEYLTVTEPTCETSGKAERTCSDCGIVEEAMIPSREHSFVSVESSADGEILYRCETCNAETTAENIESAHSKKESVFDCPVDFSFVIVTDKDEEYILANIDVTNTFFAGTEYEDDPRSVPSLNVTDLGDGRYMVSPSEAFESGTTYTVTVSGNMDFEDFDVNTIEFTTDVTQSVEVEFNENIIFILLPEEGSAESGLYSLEHNATTDMLILHLPKNNRFSEEHIGRIVCVGDYLSIEAIFADPSKRCDFGKINAIYWNEDGSCILELACPELHEIYENLDISSKDRLEITKDDIPEGFEEQAVEALLVSEDFIEFFASANIAAQTYAESRGLLLASADEASLWKKLELKPTVEVNDNTLLITIHGELPIDLTTKSGKKFGSITISFTASTEISFDITTVCQLKYFWKIPTGVRAFDFRVTQNTEFSFVFQVAINMSYSLNDDITVEKIYKTPAGIYHLKNCTQMYMYNPDNLPSYTYDEAGEIFKKNWGRLAGSECPNCRPFTSYLNGTLFFVNTSSNTVHRFACGEGDRYAVAAGELVRKLPEGEKYTYCSVCNPHKAEMIDFERMMLNSLGSESWENVVNKVKQIAKDNGVEEKADYGKNLFHKGVIVGYIFEVGIDIDLIIDFKFEGIVKYEYSCATTNVYGAKLNSDSVIVPYFHKESSTSKHTFSMVGEAGVKVGVNLEVYASFVGLSKFVYVDIYAEAGVYADLKGVLHYSVSSGWDAENGDSETKTEFYNALYLEVGLYYDVGIGYKVFLWGNQISFLGGEKKIPLLALGYDKVYYNYAGTAESLETTGKTLDLTKENLLSANCFNAKIMKSTVEALNILGESGKYSVKIKLLDDNGEVNPYCTIENGIITVKDGAPCSFDVVVVFDVEGEDDAVDTIADFLKNNYVAGSSKYTLDEYKVRVSFQNHTISDWSVLNDPTCTEEGTEIRYYTCQCVDESGAPLSETRAIKSLGHVKVTDKAIPVTCTTDGYTEGSHCSRCGEIFVEQVLIPALGHKYTDEFTCHDRPCLNSGCTHTEYATTEHNYSEWSEVDPNQCSVEKISFRFCRDCRKVDNSLGDDDLVLHSHEAEFVSTVNATCTESGLYLLVCKNCGIELNRDEPAPTGHKFGVYEWDDGGHYQKCTALGCSAMSKKEEHVFNNACDTQCDICGYTRPITHAWSGTYSTDDKNHWIECTVCKAIKDEGAHIGGVATCTTPGVCSVCGLQYIDAFKHSFVRNASDEYFISPASCVAGAKYYMSCSVCGDPAKQTFEYGDPLGHDFSDTYTRDKNQHWRECSRCDSTADKSAHKGGKATCTATAVCEVCSASYGDMLSHSGGSATCMVKAKCSSCGGEYGNLADHSYTAETISDDRIKSQATCDTKAVYYYSCEWCGKKSVNKTFEYGDALGHTYSEEFTADADAHWRKCIRCEATKDRAVHNGGNATCLVKAECTACGSEYGDFADHIGGSATCLAGAMCSVCGIEYGSLADHSYTAETVSEDRIKSQAKCLRKAVYYYSCEWCGKKSNNETFEYGDALGHTYSEEFTSDAVAHWRKCIRCEVTKDRATHSGGSATCMVKAECTACGSKYGVLADHSDTAAIVSDDRIKTQATCDTKAVYYYSCEWCGRKSDNKTFEFGDALGHTYSEKFSSDANEHWRKCVRCESKTDKAVHSGGSATCLVKASCSVCGSEHGAFADHSYTKEIISEDRLKSNATCWRKAEYYYSCEWCGKAGDDRSFEYGELLEHNFSDEYMSDANGHWHKCNGCNETTDAEPHTGGMATCTSKAKCSACGREYGTTADHSDTKQTVSEDRIKSEATCETKAVYYYSCEWCGRKSDSKTFEYGELRDHTYPAGYEHDESGHWRRCEVCDATTEVEEHGGGEATCAARAVCMICSNEYGKTPDHSFIHPLESEAACVKKATCESKGVYKYSCIACGALGTETFETNELGHEWGTEYKPSSDGSGHYRSCTRNACGKADEVLAHTGSTATCTKKAVCTVCKSEYGKLAAHVYNIKLTESDDLAAAASCETPELYYYSCVCGKNSKDETKETFEHGDPLGHDLEDGLRYNDTHHYRFCKRCKSEMNVQAHIMGEYLQTKVPTCSAVGTERSECGTCDYFVTRDIEKLKHEMLSEQAFSQGTDEEGRYLIILGNVCKNCDYYEELARTEYHIHANFDGIIYSTPPTCTEQGLTAGLVCNAIQDGKICGEVLIAQEPIPPLGHKYENGTCINCGKTEVQGSQGLQYTLNSDGKSYSVTGIGTCTDTDIVIADTYNGLPVEAIGDRAFELCLDITSIDIPDGVKTIGIFAFDGCSNITSITIPNSVTTIEQGAFFGCTSVTNLTIPDSITSISMDVFRECSSLSSITIPNSVTSIGAGAFMGCSALTNITIPNSVANIGIFAFSGCSALESITIPDGITSIGAGWFSGMSSLRSITILNTVTEIGASAFMDCSSLVSIIIPESVISVGNSAFQGCAKLTIYCEALSKPDAWHEVWNPDNRPVVWGYVELKPSEGLTFYPNFMDDDGSYYLSGVGTCTDTVIVIPDTYNGHPVTKIGVNAFMYCSNITSVIIPDGVTTIEDQAFYGCSNLTSVTIPNSITSIGLDAFTNCSALAEVHINDINAWCKINFKQIYSNPLTYAHNLYLNGNLVTNVVIPDDMTFIGNNTFSGCTALTNIVIPNSVTSIGYNAFSGCSGLTNIAIPDSVTSIGDSAFNKCSGLTEVHITDIKAWCNISFKSAFSNPLYYAHKLYLNGNLTTEIIIPTGVTSIGNYAFYDCSSLTSITIPSGVTRIGDSAFFRCSSLTSITIPDGVTSIGHGAFYNCSSLTSITIPDGVTSIGNSVFLGCTSLTSITLPDYVTSIGTHMFYGCSSLTSITIPNGVTSIRSHMFYGCSSLTSITIPDCVTSIENSAFRGCSSLVNIAIPDGVTSIGWHAFYGCSSLTNITIPFGETSIVNYVFYGCSNLTNITIPDSVTSIGEYAFSKCSSLTNITIPESVISIGDSAFDNCSSLTSITISNGVTSIGEYAFYGCSSLSSITIPDSVTNIERSAFNGCSSLTSITIPSKVANIGDYAFGNCTGISTFIFEGTKEEWEAVTKGNRWNYNTSFEVSFANEPHTHDLVKVEAKAASCTEDGNIAYWYCSSCEWMQLTGGIATNMQAVILPPTGHNLVKVEAKAASCTEEGNIEYWYCSSCEWIQLDGGIATNMQAVILPPTGHKLLLITVVEATCTEQGVKYYQCSLCGLTETITTEPYGHSLTSSTVVEATKDKDGYITNVCSVCGYIETTVIPATGSLGLAYALNTDGAAYTVTGIGTCTDTDVVIPKIYNNLPVTAIGNAAFKDCSSFTRIIIPNGVTSIGNSAFYGCSSLTSITIPDGVTSIRNSAFNNCSSLTSITIPDSVTSIENYAFSRCSSLTSINIPDSVTSIGDDAFFNCTSLLNITIPEGVTKIENYVFYGCSSLTSITIPNGVTKIETYAFSHCSSLTSINIPDSVTSIQNSAFSGCSSLTSLTIPDSVTSIQNSAFSGCSSLTSITIPNSVKSIGIYAFNQCSNIAEVHINDLYAWLNITFGGVGSNPLTYAKKLYLNGNLLTDLVIPNNVFSIGNYAFCYCTSLTSITLHDSVTSLGDSAFEGCSSLANIIIPDSVTNIGKSTFAHCSKLASINIPEGVTSIGNSAFRNCKNLTSITIPDGVTNIGSSVFSGCLNLASITIPDSVTSIGDDAFRGCSSLVSIAIPDGVTSIRQYAFFNCTSLASITIPDGVTNIGNSMFSGCSSLASITIPDGVTSIGNEAFSYCSSLTSITIPESVTSIGKNAFYNCSKLTSITIPDGVTSIGNDTFRSCSSLASITIPESVTSIGKYAFYGCSSLTSITIPDGVTSIEYYTFGGCSSLASITIPDSVTSIGVATFSGCSSLTSITIPDGVTSIGNYAFYGCSSLTSITIPDGVTSIEYYTFRDCSSLTSITIPDGVTSIGDEAFAYCKNLTSITIPESVTSIGDKAFSGLSITSITIPDGVTSIGDETFSGCSRLISITIPESVTSIGDSAFYHCRSLTSITIPDGVTNIGAYTFYACTSLTSITIPESVTSIGQYAFNGCDLLTSISFDGTMEMWEAVEKGTYWIDLYNCDVIHCTDGDVSLSSWDPSMGAK